MTNGSGGRGPLRVGGRFLKYEIRSLLGKGGHAWVYHGFDPFLDRDVAIKIIPNVGEPGEDLAERARTEARVLCKIKDDNVVVVSDGGSTDDGGVYIVMELLKGLTVRDALNHFGPLNIVEVLTLGAKIAAGVHAAHLAGAIHRDLKPENAFIIEFNGRNGIKVLDFGIAKLSGSGAATTQRDLLFGTLKYMSPEYLVGTGATRRSDIYSLGVMIYELLTGIVPCVMGMQEPTRDAITYAQLNTMPPPLDELLPGFPSFIARTIQRMIAKLPADRFESMAEVAEIFQADLERFLREWSEYAPAARELWHPSPAEAPPPAPATNAPIVNPSGNATTDVYVLSGLVPSTPPPVTLEARPSSDHPASAEDIDTTAVSKPKFSPLETSAHSSRQVQVTEPLRFNAAHTTTARLFVPATVLSLASPPSAAGDASSGVTPSVQPFIERAPPPAPLDELVLDFERPAIAPHLEAPAPRRLPEAPPAQRKPATVVRTTIHAEHRPLPPRTRDLLYLALCFGTLIGLLAATLASGRTSDTTAVTVNPSAIAQPIVVVSAQTSLRAEPPALESASTSASPAEFAPVESEAPRLAVPPPPASKPPQSALHSAPPRSGPSDKTQLLAPRATKPKARPPAAAPGDDFWLKPRDSIY